MTERPIRTVTHRSRVLELTEGLGRIDTEDLIREWSEIGAKALWWGILAAEAVADEARAKARLQITEARVAREYRLRRPLDQKLTEPMVEEAQVSDAEVQAAREAHIQAAEQAGVIRAAMFTVVAKNAMLEGMSGQVGQALQAVTPDLQERRREALAREREALRRPARTPVP